MELTDESRNFIRQHLHADLNKLLLAAGKYPHLDMPFVVAQITARRQIKDKLPAWYKNDRLVFPSKVSAEQASSELTARYKQRLINEKAVLCDLTGGLGIDSWYFSQKAGRVIYLERFSEYCKAATHNFGVLGAENITVLQGDSMELLSSLQDKNIDLFYIDPARRGEGDKRTYALSDCEPDLSRILPGLFTKANKVIAKISPMADIKQTLQLLPGTREVHVLAVKNECKELVLVLEKEKTTETPLIITWNVRTDGKEEEFSFHLQEEENLQVSFADELLHYLYEPNASLLKAGAFKSVTRLGVNKLHPSSHLYTSDHKIENFPGRSFRIEEVIPFKGKEAKKLSLRIPQANITVRNFPLSVEELRKRTKIKEGGDKYLFATTVSNGDKVLILCRKL